MRKRQIRLTLYKAARYALAAYSNVSEKRTLPEGSIFFRNDETGAEGFALKDGENLVVAFAGSNEIKDWIQNSKNKLVDIKIGNGFFAQVHQGFYECYTSISKEVQDLIKIYSQSCKRILFTGHSMGGALAMLAATEAKIAGREFRVITFGAPRLGSLSLRAYLNERVLRIIARGDLVPKTPFPWSFMRPLEFYMHVGKSIKRGYWFPGFSKPHGMDRYMDLIREIEEEYQIFK
jgi:predicted lipase